MIKTNRKIQHVSRRDSTVEICSTVWNWNLDSIGIPRLSPFDPFWIHFWYLHIPSNTASICSGFLAQWLLEILPENSLKVSKKYLWRASRGYWLSSNCWCKCNRNSSRQTIVRAASIVFDDNDLIFSTNLGGSAPAKESILGHTPRMLGPRTNPRNQTINVSCSKACPP